MVHIPGSRSLRSGHRIYLICNSCSNWVDFVKSVCEKSWIEVQADSFSFECWGWTRMKELEVEFDQLRQLVVEVVGRKQVGCTSGSGGGIVDDKVGEDDERDVRESSTKPGRRLRGGKVTGRRETGRKETGLRETGRKETGLRETGHKETGRRETGRKETRRKEMERKTNGSKEIGVGKTVAKESGGQGDDS